MASRQLLEEKGGKMPEQEKAMNAVIVDSVEQTKRFVLDPAVVKESGMGKAYQYVAQTSAFAVGSGADFLRGITHLGIAGVAVALSNMMSSPPESVEQWSPVVDEVMDTVSKAADQFDKIGKKAGKVLAKFPSGEA